MKAYYQKKALKKKQSAAIKRLQNEDNIKEILNGN
jgi:hypothetical protein